MKKILDLLEKYVQWITLALGVAFLFYMVWSYVFVNPAAKPLAGSTDIATPATVDHLINDGAASELDQKEHGSPLPGWVIKPPNNAPVDLNAPSTTQPAALAAAAWDSWALDPDLIQKKLDQSGGQAVVTALPALPPLQYVDQEPLRTVLGTPDASGNVADKHDQDSVTTFWSLPLKPLGAAFTSAFVNKLPSGQQTVLFAHADLIRQEQLGDGSWGPETIIADRIFNSPPPPPFPSGNGDNFKKQATDYKDWLDLPKSQRSIVSADFPSIAFPSIVDLQWKPLDQWVAYRATLEAQESAPIPAGAPPVTQPTPAPAGAPARSGPFDQTNQPQQQQNAQPNQGTRGRRGGGSGGGFGGRGRSTITTGQITLPMASNGGTFGEAQPGGATAYSQPNRAAAPAQGAAPVFGAPAPQVATASPTAETPEAPQAAAPAVVIPALPKLQPVPDGEFNPSVSADNGDMELYFHDPTVEAGKTYRYKVRYGIFNPVYDHPEQVDKSKPEFASAFTINSPDSEWSEAVIVPPRTRFWCAAIQPHGKQASVAFTIFSWHNGIWQHQASTAAPGDEVGDGQFLTHWTLLDVKVPRANSDKRFVLLVPDNGGPAEQRNMQADSTSPDFLKFKHDYIDTPPAVDANGNPTGVPGQAAPPPASTPPAGAAPSAAGTPATPAPPVQPPPPRPAANAPVINDSAPFPHGY